MAVRLRLVHRSFWLESTGKDDYFTSKLQVNYEGTVISAHKRGEGFDTLIIHANGEKSWLKNRGRNGLSPTAKQAIQLGKENIANRGV